MVLFSFQYLFNRPGVRGLTFQPRRDTGLHAQENGLSLATNNTYRKQPSRSKSDVLLERNDRIWEEESNYLDHFRRRKSRKTVEAYDAVTDISDEPGGHGLAKTLLECRAALIYCQDLEEWIEQ
ncbi:hypothetical protein P879_09218 [Paragonimus westermani]|uniref:Uncharacterized protein n=1 Tax=Paragonimus westermani TaxID=34504 RepID=A0A8T0DF49_9TREM|nr:hypothetical protein P879_09218 [Paragonimus westermani]